MEEALRRPPKNRNPRDFWILGTLCQLQPLFAIHPVSISANLTIEAEKPVNRAGLNGQVEPANGNGTAQEGFGQFPGHIDWKTHEDSLTIEPTPAVAR